MVPNSPSFAPLSSPLLKAGAKSVCMIVGGSDTVEKSWKFSVISEKFLKNPHTILTIVNSYDIFL